MKYPSLKYGQKNKAVLALQNGLRRWHKERGLEFENKANKVYGVGTKQDINRFKRAMGITPVVGTVFGSEAWSKLKPYLGEYDRSLIRQYNRAVVAAIAELKAKRLAAKAANSAEARRARVRAVALRFYAARAHYTYRQVRPMLDGIFDPINYNRLDCSSSFTMIFKEAGEPDPNGRGYDGQGYTGTLVERGSWVINDLAADAFFYGDQGGGVPRHVVCGIGGGAGVSFGSTPVRLVSKHYRGDLRGAMRYIR